MPFASFTASSFAQKCIKKRRGSTFSMRLSRAVPGSAFSKRRDHSIHHGVTSARTECGPRTAGEAGLDPLVAGGHLQVFVRHTKFKSPSGRSAPLWPSAASTSFLRRRLGLLAENQTRHESNSGSHRTQNK